MLEVETGLLSNSQFKSGVFQPWRHVGNKIYMVERNLSSVWPFVSCSTSWKMGHGSFMVLEKLSFIDTNQFSPWVSQTYVSNWNSLLVFWFCAASFKSFTSCTLTVPRTVESCHCMKDAYLPLSLHTEDSKQRWEMSQYQLGIKHFVHNLMCSLVILTESVQVLCLYQPATVWLLPGLGVGNINIAKISARQPYFHWTVWPHLLRQHIFSGLQSLFETHLYLELSK
jgi:hypothetical protein